MSDSPIESTKELHESKERKPETRFDPHCEDCCDPVTSCRLHAPPPRGEAETPTDTQRLSNVVYVLLGTRDPDKVRDWINLAYSETASLTILAARLLCELGYATEPRLDVKGISVEEALQQEPAPWTAPAPRPLTFEQAQAVLAEYRARRPNAD